MSGKITTCMILSIMVILMEISNRQAAPVKAAPVRQYETFKSRLIE